MVARNGSLRVDWRALVVSPVRQRVRRGCRGSRADFVVQAAAFLGMDNAGCRLNCNLAPTAAPAQAVKGARWAALARCDPANQKCRHVEPAAVNGRFCNCCLAADMGFQLSVAKTAAGPAPAPVDCGVEAVNCCFHFRYEAADMGFPPLAKAARRVAIHPGWAVMGCQRSVDDSPSACGHRVRAARRAEPAWSFHGWQSDESARASLR